MNSVLDFDADDFKPHEECGVFGVYSFDGALSPAYACYNGLLALQHRGQESCGIAVTDTYGQRKVLTTKLLQIWSEKLLFLMFVTLLQSKNQEKMHNQL